MRNIYVTEYHQITGGNAADSAHNIDICLGRDQSAPISPAQQLVLCHGAFNALDAKIPPIVQARMIEKEIQIWMQAMRTGQAFDMEFSDIDNRFPSI